MANRRWGLEFLSRRGSSTLSDEDAPTQTGKKPSARVQTLCSMRQKSGSAQPATSSTEAVDHASDAAAVTVARRQSDQDRKRPGSKNGIDRPDSRNGKLSSSSSATDVASDTAAEAASTAAVSPTADPQEQWSPTHDTAYPGVADSTGQYQSGVPADHGADDANGTVVSQASSNSYQTHDSSTSLTNSNSSSNSLAAKKEVSAGEAVEAELASSMLPVDPTRQQQQPAGGSSGASPRLSEQGRTSAVPPQPATIANGSNPADGFMNAPPATVGAPAASAGGGTVAELHAMLLGELQREAGLDPQQTARAAALLQRFAASGQTSTPPLVSPVAPAAPASQNPAWPPAAAPNPLQIPNPSSGVSPGISPAGGLSPSGYAGTAAGFNSVGGGRLGAPGLGFGEGGPGPAGYNPNAGSAVYMNGTLGGLDSSVHSSAASNLQSASGNDGAGNFVTGQNFAGMGPAAGGVGVGNLSSPEAVYGTDGVDVPGTAQVAVHNVPFKWCNADLEALFKHLPGYLDAQLLFHENGRSKGVGVGLFRDVNTATEACGRLSGVQADGRKLELVLMSPDNHISFSCKQVAVLGLPWEYTAADVCELIEAATVADNDPPGEAGVEAVEVAYREDGKSEGRAIATFRTRRQAHKAITRLHGRETLTGLRMRLFYLHEQQQRQHLLAQAPQSLITSMGQLNLEAPTPTAAVANSYKDTGIHTGILAETGGDVESAVSGGGSAALSGGGATGEEGALSSSRSSFEKDQGPVILHVSGLMESVSREQLRELFSQAGEVTKVDIPDGGRSMGYGFITFSNPQAAEQAMLLFNNYPLGGGAIHVAYSTSATAKARQQALRQARKATLGASGRASMEGRMSGAGDGMSATRLGAKPSTPRGGAALSSGLGALGSSLPSNRRSLTGGVSFDAPSSGMSSFEALLGNVGPTRHSFDHPGFTSPSLGMRGGAGGGLFGPGGPNGNRYTNYNNMAAGLTPAQLQQLQLLQAAGGPAAAAASAALAAGTPAAFDQGPSFEQLLMQMASMDPAAAAAAGLRGGVGGPPGYGAPGTPTGGHFGAPSPGGHLSGGLFGGTPRGLAPPGIFGTGAGALGGGLGMGGLGGAGGAGGMFGGPGAAGLGALGAAASLGMPGLPLSSAFGSTPGASTFGSLAAAGAAHQAATKSVVVTGMPLGLDESQVIQLFQICGPVQNIHKPADSEVAIVTYDSLEGATRAIQILDGTNMPSGGTLTVRLAPLPGAMDHTAALNAASGLGSLSPGPFGNPAPNVFGAGGLGTGADRPGGDGAPTGWEFVASGVGESNIFAQGSGSSRGLSVGQGSGLGRHAGSDGGNMFGLGPGGDGGVGGGFGKPPAPVYPGGSRQLMTRSPSPGAAVAAALASGAGSGSGATSPAPIRQAQGRTASPAVSSSELFGKPSVGSAFHGSEALGFGSGTASGSASQSRAAALGGTHGSAPGLPGLDVGGFGSDGAYAGAPHLISPAGDAAGRVLERDDGSWGSLNAHQSVGSGAGSGNES